MRKITILASAAGLALSLSGCGKTEEAAPAASEAAATASEAAPAASAEADDGAAAATESGDNRGNLGDRG